MSTNTAALNQTMADDRSNRETELIDASVCFAVPGQPIWYKSCQLPLGSTVKDAICLSGFETAYPWVDWQVSGVGVFGQQTEPEAILAQGDRVEVYQPLTFDPKESRRRRAQHRRLKLLKEIKRMEASLLVETLACQDGSSIGVATLNRPQTLNGLSLEMTRLLDQALQQWASQDNVVAVIFKGAGEKAFCAGGDLHGLYHEMLEQQGKPAHSYRYANDFFSEEYALDYKIHTYNKPIICWGDGIVMGGGMGLMAGASHRIVTNTSRLAMPEINIGLFPDVGGSWLLARCPGQTGLFLALTGALIGASDAIYASMADHAIAREQWGSLVESLQAQAWSRSAADFQHVTDVIHSLPPLPLEPGPLEKNRTVIDRACQGFELERVAENLIGLSEASDPWLQKASHTFQKGCPASARLSWLLLKRARHLSLAEVFRMEFTAATECAASGNFQEGIRAVLIDKDRNPKWQPATLAETSGDWADRYFSQSIQDPEHPLAHLGRS